jgi:uncharacterized protein involved in outer membrane biogenesis
VNSLYIGIGTTIIAALLAALLAPFFIDWTTYRTTFEREGERMVGSRVTVLGQIDLRLLPIPTLTVADVVVGEVERPILKINRFEMQLELSPLLKGEFRITQMRLERPAADIVIGRDGVLVLNSGARIEAGDRWDLSQTSLENVEIVDGRVAFADERGNARASVEKVNATLTAGSLAGPFRATGGGEINGVASSFQIGTGRLTQDGTFPVKVQIGFADDPVTIAVDAAASLGRGIDAGRPKATGSIVVQRVEPQGKQDKGDRGPLPWKVEGKFDADSARAMFDAIAITVGPEDRAYGFNGTLNLELGAKPTFDASLTAKQIDLDRALVAKVGEAADLDQAVSVFATFLRGLPEMPLPGRLTVEVPGLVLGGGVLQDLKIVARPRLGGLAVEQFDAKLPGRTRLSTSGRLMVKEPGSFEGRLFIASDQPASFAAWLKKDQTTARLDPFTLDAAIKIDDTSIRADQVVARLGSAQARGFLEWARPKAGHGTSFSTGLTADRLDLDQLGALAALFGVKPSADRLAAARVDLNAGQVVVGGISARNVSARFAVEGDRIAIDRLDIQDAAGAAISAAGKIDRASTTPDGAIEASVKADRLDGLASLLQTLFGNSDAMKRLVAAGPHLGPFDVKAKLLGQATAERSDVRVTVAGTAAGSALSLDGRFVGRAERWRDGRVDLEARLDGPDGGRLLRQLGVPALSFKGATGGVTLTARGVPADRLDTDATLDVAGTRMALVGKTQIADTGALGFDGRATVSSKDVGSLAMIVGQALPGVGDRIPIEIAASVIGQWPRVEIKALEGRYADVPLNARGRFDFSADPVKLDGEMALGALELGTLMELGLGADSLGAPLAKPTDVWPTQVLAGPIVQGLQANIAVTADRMVVDERRTLDRAAMRLRLRPSDVSIDDLKGGFKGGTVVAAITIKRAPNGETGLTGSVKLAGVPVEELVWRRDGRAVANGLADINATFDGAGRSVSAIIAGLSGGGALTIKNGLARYANTEAFNAIIVAADGGLDLKEDKIRTVFQGYLDSGTLPFDRVEAAFAIGGGVARLREITVESPRARTSGSAAFDLGRWTLDGDWSLTVDAGKNAVTGAQPQIGVVFSGPLDTPSRKLDVAPLAAFLTLRAFEREVNRIEALQQDIMERERFARELKRLRDERVRREQEARDAEQLRRAEEERRRQEALAGPIGSPNWTNQPTPTVSGQGAAPSTQASGGLPPLSPAKTFSSWPPPSPDSGAASGPPLPLR